MVHLFPKKMTTAIDLVRRERNDISLEVVRVSRTIVKIRNGVIALAFGLLLWLPFAIALQTPSQFLTTAIAYLALSGVMVAIVWYVVARTRYQAMAVLEEIADRHPEKTEDLADLLRVPWYLLPFGPWYKPMYLPAFASRMLDRLVKSFVPR